MDKKPWTIHPYAPGDEHGILTLFNGVFAENNPDYQPRTLEEWYWQFRDSPLGNQTTVAKDEDGRIIGQYAALPYRTWLRGEEQVTSQIVDSCIAAEYRRSLKREGVFISVATRYFDIFAYGHPTVLCYGYPIPNAERIGVRFLGYIPILKPIKLLGAEMHDRQISLAASMGRGVTVEKVERFDDRATDLWESLKPEINYAIIRDKDFYNWRYVAHPRYNYRCLQALRDNTVVGILVYSLGWNGQPVTHLMDLFTQPDDQAAQAALVAVAAEEALKEKMHLVKIWLPPNGKWFNALRSFGFNEYDSPHPLINRLFSDWMDNDWLMENYYFGMGDSDTY